jgi:choice-of-anchor C domain-containing protein
VKRRSLFATLGAMTASLALAGTMLAAGPFTNGSFENGTYADGGSGFQTLSAGASNITGWDIGDGGIDWIGSLWTAQDPSKSIDMNATSAGSISQTFDTTAGATYFVSFWLAGNPTINPACTTGPKTLDVIATGGTTSSYSFDTTLTSYTAMGWLAKGYTFTASGTSTTLAFTSTTTGACGPALDNVGVTQVASTGASCKNGGWATNVYVDSNGNVLTFKNQGACVSHFATSGAVPIGS